MAHGKLVLSIFAVLIVATLPLSQSVAEELWTDFRTEGDYPGNWQPAVVETVKEVNPSLTIPERKHWTFSRLTNFRADGDYPGVWQSSGETQMKEENYAKLRRTPLMIAMDRSQWTDFRDQDYPGNWEPHAGFMEKETYAGFEAVLFPGMGTYCNQEFVAHNLSGEDAEFHLVFGEEREMEKVKPNSRLAYNLMEKTNDEEIRIINSGEAESPIRVECK